MFLRLIEMILVKKLAERLAYLLLKLIITITATVIITVTVREQGPTALGTHQPITYVFSWRNLHCL